MLYIDFLKGNPVVAFMLLLVLLITVVPAGAALYRKYHPSTHSAEKLPEVKPVRFLGTQLDLAILIFGTLILLAILVPLFR
jgi:hypothetical protein